MMYGELPRGVKVKIPAYILSISVPIAVSLVLLRICLLGISITTGDNQKLVVILLIYPVSIFSGIAFFLFISAISSARMGIKAFWQNHTPPYNDSLGVIQVNQAEREIRLNANWEKLRHNTIRYSLLSIPGYFLGWIASILVINFEEEIAILLIQSEYIRLSYALLIGILRIPPNLLELIFGGLNLGSIDSIVLLLLGGPPTICMLFGSASLVDLLEQVYMRKLDPAFDSSDIPVYFGGLWLGYLSILINVIIVMEIVIT